MPAQLSGQLPKDADLAAVLATCVAGLIEKQAVFLSPRAEGSTSVLIAGAAASIFIPGAGLATLVGTSLYGEHLLERLREQSDRVGLELLAAAGLSPRVAPHAFELAEAKHGQLKPNARVSARVSSLYRALAERDRRTIHHEIVVEPNVVENKSM